MVIKIFLTELWPFKLGHFGQLFILYGVEYE